jgi:hypothetical protein
VSEATRTTLRRGIAAATCLLALAAAPAQAQRPLGTFFPAQTVDGPSPDIRAVGDVDVARDGAGLLTFVRRDVGEDHVFASIIDGGIPQGAFRVDGGQGPLIGLPVAATANGGRMAIAFANAAGVWVSLRPASGTAFGPPQQIAPAGAADPSIDLSINGAGYLAWSQGGDVRSAYLARGASGFVAHPAPLDADGSRDAGSGPAMRPRVTASADGIGLAAWGERDGAGMTHVIVRRLVRDRISVVAPEANAATIEGLSGGSADMPDVSFEDDSSYAWVVFRQQAIDGQGKAVLRGVGRRLRGSAFDDPAAIDGGGALGPDAVPRIGLNGRGQGIATVEAPGSTLAAVVKDDALTPARVVGSAAAVPSQPVAGFAENFDGAVAWLQPGAGDAVEVRGRLLEDDIALAQPPPFGPDVLLSDPSLGSVVGAAGLDADVTRAGDALIAFVQQNADGRRLVVAAYDRVPGAPEPTTSTGWRRAKQPVLAWADSFDVWGGLTYSILLDGQPVGTATSGRFTMPTPILDGIHRWQVIATDRRGQVARSASRNLRIDSTPPRMLIKVEGKRQTGKRITFYVRAIDLRSPAGSGIRQVRIDYRDGTVPVVTTTERPIFSHFFARRGTYKVRISTQDGAGNYLVAYRTVKVKAPPKKKKGKGKKKRKRKAPEPQQPKPETPVPPVDEEQTTPTEPTAPGEPVPDPGGTGVTGRRGR